MRLAGRGSWGRLLAAPVVPRFVMTFIAEQFGGELRTAEVRPPGADLGVAFRADAKAEGESVSIGGWDCRGGVPPHRARWFAVSLTRRNAPWAFAKGEPFRTIASLELYATLVSFVIFKGSWPHSPVAF